jgi:tripartite-type tricarboxylate transporter receptor subunit TctC
MVADRVFRRVSLVARSLVALLTIAGFSDAVAQSYPTNAIRIVAPSTAGGLPDVLSRIIASELAEAEGWRVVIENRAGALGTTAMADVLKQPADGHSIFSMPGGVMAAPALLPNMGVRLDSDFAPVVRISTSYLALVVSPTLSVRSTSELVDALKSHPDKFNISVGLIGTPGHLLAEVFKLQTGARATIVPYQQPQQRLADLLSGTTHFGFFPTPLVVNLVAANKVRALAVTARKRLAVMEDVPTVAEEGFPELALAGEDWMGFAVRSGTSENIVARLNQAVNKALGKQYVRDALARLGADPAGGTSAEFGALIASQLVYWERIVKQAGIKMPQ